MDKGCCSLLKVKEKYNYFFDDPPIVENSTVLHLCVLWFFQGALGSSGYTFIIEEKCLWCL